uniref:Uncharacterized protein n=1 Tax=Anguilla anguilla TaxID=7936 RepID=A0A0E9TNC4_ANGAN
MKTQRAFKTVLHWPLLFVQVRPIRTMPYSQCRI